MIVELAGGIGLFLLGMLLMTDGLKSLGGNLLRDWLARFTGRPWRAVATGAAITALIQSSSATAVTTIGFVSAGLLAFPQAVGVMLGAAIGTTSTGWIVSLVGLKVQLGTAALPVVFAGALLRLLAPGRGTATGTALAGFGLIFAGIGIMQGGMETLAARVDPAALPAEGVLGRLLLVPVGVGMTVLMQSSSAAAATTLTALHSGALTLPAAAALVIGQNLGTTVTTVLASSSGTVSARRTALAHVLFSAFAGAIGFLLVPALLRIASSANGAGEVVLLAGFHTTFNLLGALLVLPVIAPVSRWIERVIPERGALFTRHLDASVAQVPPVAIEAARRATRDTATETFDIARRTLIGGPDAPRSSRARAAQLLALGSATTHIESFLGHVQSAPGDDSHARHTHILHALDHIRHAVAALEDETAQRPVQAGQLLRERERLAELLAVAIRRLNDEPDGRPPTAEDAARVVGEFAEHLRTRRHEVLAGIAASPYPLSAGIELIEGLRWLDLFAYHAGRALTHLTAIEDATGSPFPASDGDGGDLLA